MRQRATQRRATVADTVAHAVRLLRQDEMGRDLAAAQCQHVRAISITRVDAQRGNIGPVALGQVRNTLALLLDL